MKKVLISLIIIGLFASLAGAEVLQGAMTNGQGKWGGLLAVRTISNFNNVSGASSLAYGGYASYGLTDNIDIEIPVGLGSATGITGVSKASATQYGLAVKYGIIKEGEDMPVSVAALIGYRATSNSMTITGLGDVTRSDSDIGIGVGVSKVCTSSPIPLIPYASLAYHSLSFGSNAVAASSTATQMDINIGTGIPWSEHGAVFVEATSQSISATGLSYTQTEIAVGAGMLF